jgi:hypothetical protein
LLSSASAAASAAAASSAQAARAAPPVSAVSVLSALEEDEDGDASKGKLVSEEPVAVVYEEEEVDNDEASERLSQASRHSFGSAYHREHGHSDEEDEDVDEPVPDDEEEGGQEQSGLADSAKPFADASTPPDTSSPHLPGAQAASSPAPLPTVKEHSTTLETVPEKVPLLRFAPPTLTDSQLSQVRSMSTSAPTPGLKVTSPGGRSFSTGGRLAPELLEGWLMKRVRSITGIGHAWKKRCLAELDAISVNDASCSLFFLFDGSFRFCRIDIPQCSLATSER